jgi:hypothetical protein
MALEILSALALLITFQTAGAGGAGGGASNDIMTPIMNSLNEFGTTAAHALPNVVAALILLGIGLLIGKIVGWVVSKVIKTLNLEHYWSQSAIGKATSNTGWNMSRIFGTGARWFIYLFFIAAAVNVLQFAQISQAINNVWLWIPNVVAFLIVLVMGSLLADFAGSFVQRELPKRGIIAGKMMGLAVTGILYAIVLAVAVTQLGIGQQILSSVITALIWGLAAAIAIGFGVGLAYGLREAILSVIKASTVIQPSIKQGQRISVNAHRGIVQEVGAFSVILKDEEGKTIVIPTKNLTEEEIVIEAGPQPETQEKMMEREGQGPSSSSYSAAA